MVSDAPPDPSETARRCLTLFPDQTGLASAALYHFTSRGDVIALAACGRLRERVAPGATLPPAEALLLCERSTGGPWIQPRPGRNPDEKVAAAFLPVLHGGEVVGLLEAAWVDGPPDAGTRELVRCLSDLYEFAAQAGSELGPALAAAGEVSGARVALEALLAQHSFRPVFQPILDLAERKIRGYEALIRFADGSRPDLRFAEAGAAGLGTMLELACLRASLEAAAAFPDDLFLSLNVSPGIVLKSSELARLLSTVKRPLILELTEHVSIDDYNSMRAAIVRLGPNVRIAVDDAGAGFSTLHHLLALKPNVVKLDLALVRGIETDLVRQSLVAGVVHFAARTACVVIAEGIETEEELEAMRTLRVPLGQGFLLGRPSPPAGA